MLLDGSGGVCVCVCGRILAVQVVQFGKAFAHFTSHLEPKQSSVRIIHECNFRIVFSGAIVSR